MLELSGMGTVVRGLGMLYWLLAIGALSLALWKGKGWQQKTLWTGVAIAVFGFLPVKGMVERAKRDAYSREAWAYFKKKCEAEAGEKIYKTFTGVKSVLVVKPLPPATEANLYDQYWYGDPYSNDSTFQDRGDRVASLLMGQVDFKSNTHARYGFDFVESGIEARGHAQFWKIESLKYPPYSSKSSIAKPISRFGISWEDISTQEDRKHWVAGSRLRIVDLADNSLVAERVGYLIESGFGATTGQRRPWRAARGANTTCPALVNRDFSDRWFVLKVLNPN